MKMMKNKCYQDQALIIMQILRLVLKIHKKMKISNFLDHQLNGFNNKKTPAKNR